MSNTIHPPAHIPPGVADYFWQVAALRRQLEYTLLDTFRGWGYSDIIPPTLEYADTLAAASDAVQQELIHRFQDNDGQTLALRYDMTLATARLVGTRLHDAPMPQRFCYAGSVFRHWEPLAGQQREFWQAGVELIGAKSPDADAEILAVTAKALEAAGLRNFRLALGQIQYFYGLLNALHLGPESRTQLHRAMMRRSEPDLHEFFSTTRMDATQQAAIEGFLHLASGDQDSWDPVLAEAESHCLNSEMHAALDNLRAIRTVLKAYGVAHYLHLDLTEVRSLGYYTGITFQALVPGLGQGVAGGGRYDNLIARFGPSQPAVGVALGLERILLVRKMQLEQQNGNSAASTDYAPDVLVAAQGNAKCYQMIERWRQQGVRIALDVSQTFSSELQNLARSHGVQRILVWMDEGFNAYKIDLNSTTTGQNGALPKRLTTENDFQQYVRDILQARART